jgi:hypothetical protein
MSSKSAAPRRVLPRSPFANAPVAEVPTYTADDRVCHDRHGLGRIVKVETESVVVDFGAGNLRRVPRSSAKLTKL